MKYLVLFLLKLFLVVRSHESDSCPVGLGTTQNFEEIFIGKCQYFINVVQKNNCHIQKANFDCHVIWDEFKQAVLNKNPCDLKIQTFSKLVEITKHSIPNDLSLFWCGTNKLAHQSKPFKILISVYKILDISIFPQVSKDFGYFTLEDTLIGYILNELSFCSARNQTWFTPWFIPCPEECITSHNRFWVAVSTDFAMRTRGRTVVILNGTRAIGAVSNSSTFMAHEVMSLLEGQVTEMKVVLVHDPNKEKFETCNQPKTLTYLENVLKSKNIQYVCVDDVLDGFDVRHYMCFSDHWSPDCKAIKHQHNSPSLLNRSPAIETQKLVYLSFIGLVFWIKLN